MAEYSFGGFPPPRIDFEVGGREASFEDVNKKELRLAELSRLDQMLINSLNFVSAVLLMQLRQALARWPPTSPWGALWMVTRCSQPLAGRFDFKLKPA